MFRPVPVGIGLLGRMFRPVPVGIGHLGRMFRPVPVGIGHLGRMFRPVPVGIGLLGRMFRPVPVGISHLGRMFRPVPVGISLLGRMFRPVPVGISLLGRIFPPVPVVKTISNTDITCRQSVTNFLEYSNQGVPAWLHATRFFQSAALLMSLTSVMSSIFCTFVRKTFKKRDAQVAAAVMNFVAAGSMLIGSSIYGGQYRYVTWLKGYYLSWSFAFSILSGVAHLVSGSIYMFAPADLASIQPTSNQPQPPGANVNNHNAYRAEPSAPPPDPAYYIPPPGGGYHPQYPPSSFTNPPYPPSNTSPQYPASTSQRHPLNSGQNPSSTQNAGNDTQNDNDTCVVCLDRRSAILLRPCNHFNLCEVCSRSLNQCPTCRGAIQDKIKPYR